MVDYPLTLRTLLAERDELRQDCERLKVLLSNVGFPIGHFYSPLVDVCNPHAIAAIRSRLTAPLPAGVAIEAEAMTAMLSLLELFGMFGLPL